MMLSFPVASKARSLSPVVNLGGTRPTGSIDQKCYKITRLIVEFPDYLNRGTGNACAGHCNVRLLLDITLKLLELSIDGNFGETRPTGSEETKRR